MAGGLHKMKLPQTPNPRAVYTNGDLESELVALSDSTEPKHFVQAAIDWYSNRRVWRPISKADADNALVSSPPLFLKSRGFVSAESWATTSDGDDLFPCFRNFGSTWHLIYATIDEHSKAVFPVVGDEE